MRPDVVIAGAGLIGMTCALECQRRGLRVALLDKGRAGLEASWAAAGMLAAHDPGNLPAMQELSLLSLALYPTFLNTLTEATGIAVPFQTEWTLEEADGAHADTVPPYLLPNNLQRIAEQSVDPRHLSATVVAAVKARGIDMFEGEAVQSVDSHGSGVEVRTTKGVLHGSAFVDCSGAWSPSYVRPAKGQMLRVDAPGALFAGSLGNMVVRTHDVYLVPRLDGSLIIGATVEHVGFDKTVSADDLERLRARAVALLPSLRSAPVLEQWAGLRPATTDGLPIIGPRSGDGVEARVFVATGHFRNGVLLAPATAHVVAQLLLQEAPSVDLHAFQPHRASLTEQGKKQENASLQHR